MFRLSEARNLSQPRCLRLFTSATPESVVAQDAGFAETSRAMSRVDRTFLRGLAALLPMALTIYIVFWLVVAGEEVFRTILMWVMPDHWYRRGMGFAVALVVVYAVGVLMSAWMARALYRLGERLLEQIPIVKSIYGMLRDMLGYFAQGRSAKFDRVVLVRLGDTGMTLVGLVTRDDLSGLPGPLADTQRIGVYLPMSYQIGGFLVMLPRAQVEPIDMSMEDALRFTVTAGMGRRGAADAE